MRGDPGQVRPIHVMPSWVMRKFGQTKKQMGFGICVGKIGLEGPRFKAR